MNFFSKLFTICPFLVLFFILTFVLRAEGERKTDASFFEEQRRHIESSDPEEIRDAIDKLSFVKSNQGIRDIISALRGAPNFPLSTQNSPVVKFYSAKALGKKGDSIAVAPIISEFNERSGTIIEHQKKKKKIQDTVSGNESLSSPYFFGSEDISIVLACGEMLRALGVLPLSAESERTIKQALTHQNFYIRASAADALFLIGKVELSAALPEIISREKNPYSKISMVSALAGLERLPNQNFKILTSELSNEDPEIRKKASEGLARMDLKLGAVYLEKAISVENDARTQTQMREDYQFLTRFRVP